MSDCITIARPYAKALFECAMAEKKLAEWSTFLGILAQAVLTPEAQKFVDNPASTTTQHIDLLKAVISSELKENEQVNNLISLLAVNKRLQILPDIYMLYQALRAEQEKTLDVEVLSHAELSTQQQERLIESLSNRLQRKVALKINIDPSLLGGAVIRAGDLVIDGSVRGKLNKLATELAA